MIVRVDGEGVTRRYNTDGNIYIDAPINRKPPRHYHQWTRDEYVDGAIKFERCRVCGLMREQHGDDIA